MHFPSPLQNRTIAARWTFGFALAIYLHRYLTHTLVHQMQQPLLSDSAFDYTYWLYQGSGFVWVFVKHSAGAIVFDLILLVSTLYCCITGAARTLAVMISALAWTFYCLTYNSYSCHHNVTVIGIMILPYAFLAKKESSFALVWKGFRYFCLYVYADAFLNKVFIGRNVFDLSRGVEVIKTNQALYMTAHPGSAFTGLYTFFITHPLASYAGFLLMVMLQGIMLTGFFTRKWDSYLFYIPIIFHTLTWIFVDVFFYEILILNLTLLPLGKKDLAGPPA